MSVAARARVCCACVLRRVRIIPSSTIRALRTQPHAGDHSRGSEDGAAAHRRPHARRRAQHRKRHAHDGSRRTRNDDVHVKDTRRAHENRGLSRRALLARRQRHALSSTVRRCPRTRQRTRRCRAPASSRTPLRTAPKASCARRKPPHAQQKTSSECSRPRHGPRASRGRGLHQQHRALFSCAPIAAQTGDESTPPYPDDVTSRPNDQEQTPLLQRCPATGRRYTTACGATANVPSMTAADKRRQDLSKCLCCGHALRAPITSALQRGEQTAHKRTRGVSAVKKRDASCGQKITLPDVAGATCGRVLRPFVAHHMIMITCLVSSAIQKVKNSSRVTVVTSEERHLHLIPTLADLRALFWI